MNKNWIVVPVVFSSVVHLNCGVTRVTPRLESAENRELLGPVSDLATMKIDVSASEARAMFFAKNGTLLELPKGKRGTTAVVNFDRRVGASPDQPPHEFRSDLAYNATNAAFDAGFGGSLWFFAPKSSLEMNRRSLETQLEITVAGRPEGPTSRTADELRLDLHCRQL